MKKLLRTALRPILILLVVGAVNSIVATPSIGVAASAVTAPLDLGWE